MKPFSSQSSQKSCESELWVSVSQSLLEEHSPEPLSQHLQASTSRGSEPLSSLDLPCGSLVASEYLPFFRTYGNLLTVEEPAPLPKVCRDQNIREAPFSEDPEPPSGFFPYYRSKEESFPSLVLPDRLYGGSQHLHTRKEVLTGCVCRMTVSCQCSAASASPGILPRSFSTPPCSPILLLSAGHSHDSSLTVPLSSDAAFRGPGLCASGFVPYYRTPEEKLHTSPGPPSSLSGSREPAGVLPRPAASRV
ncbi:uncharacterized protein LOC116586545 isoform X1 [Mustela erminea]|uniref:uncharacterized protein LOC116586545 isoform X1 n=1 Tax=Mustela erminea TaxID=36723 RepID=UPI0013875B13|nr:uncharacterized protein LOC116586545 isoform X1 [Mustela erminea]XP_032192547.1 uncharacterized protein LOC116586545 isoform X1 [Mustela erminea]XP_032192548.1 uncharacterized protein LOC116586545 isoform X1 [Mustela erminea]